MSTSTAGAGPVARHAPTPRQSPLPNRVPNPTARPRPANLRLVPPRRSTAARAPFLVSAVTLLVLGLLGLLWLNTMVAQQSFRLHDLGTQGRLLTQREQDLQVQFQAENAPAVLGARALALGMVPGGPPGFLRLPDGKVLGNTAPAAAPTPSTTPTAAGAAPPAAGGTTRPGTPAGGSRPGTPAGGHRSGTSAGATRPSSPAGAGRPAAATSTPTGSHSAGAPLPGPAR